MVILEFLPNPVGKDADGEYISLFNNGQASVSLSGWKLKSSGSKSFSLSGTMAAQATLKLLRSTTGISLKNTGETVTLISPSGAVADSLNYSGTAGEGIPVTHGLALTAEIKNKLFDDLPGKDLPNAALHTSTSFWFMMILVGVILSGLSVYILKHVKDDPYQV